MRKETVRTFSEDDDGMLTEVSTSYLINGTVQETVDDFKRMMPNDKLVFHVMEDEPLEWWIVPLIVIVLILCGIGGITALGWIS